MSITLPLQKFLENPPVGIASSSYSNIFFQTQVFHLMFYPVDKNNARFTIHFISACLWIEVFFLYIEVRIMFKDH